MVRSNLARRLPMAIGETRIRRTKTSRPSPPSSLGFVWNGCRKWRRADQTGRCNWGTNSLSKGSSYGHFRKAFPPDGGQRDYGQRLMSGRFDPGLDVLDREMLQNTLDAVKSTGQKVRRAVFRIIRLAGDDLRDYQRALRWTELEEHLKASTTNGQKLGTLIRDGLEEDPRTTKNYPADH